MTTIFAQAQRELGVCDDDIASSLDISSRQWQRYKTSGVKRANPALLDKLCSLIDTKVTKLLHSGKVKYAMLAHMSTQSMAKEWDSAVKRLQHIESTTISIDKISRVDRQKAKPVFIKRLTAELTMLRCINKVVRYQRAIEVEVGRVRRGERSRPWPYDQQFRPIRR